MSFLITQPDLVSVAATELANIDSTLGQATSASAARTMQLVAAGADEVSAAVAAAFGSHALDFHAVGAQAAAVHRQFVQALNAAAAEYAAAEAANAAATANPWQAVQQGILNAINAPTELLLQRPLIGDGADGAPGTGQDGGTGGILWGNGGDGGSGAAGQNRRGPK
ncbi:PE family protein, partial [Mycobacterium conspicuum]|uniref:PE family protein n=1 Tax=Mycobacterium conspicuum TaxID=44010 RepID=UPI0023E04005